VISDLDSCPSSRKELSQFFDVYAALGYNALVYERMVESFLPIRVQEFTATRRGVNGGNDLVK
jgi:hypothetical protein